MKRIFQKMVEPNPIVGFLFFNLGMGLLVYVFASHLEDSPIAYVSYLLSTYALILFVVWFYKTCRHGTQLFKNDSKLYKLYDEHAQNINKISLGISLSINFVYGLLKLILGIYYRSAWFVTFATYYLLLFFMRATMMRAVAGSDFGHDLRKEGAKMRHVGLALLILNPILSGMIILIIHQNRTITYPGYLIYFVALYDFYLVINAFINVFKARQAKSPILISTKCINLTVAMTSILSLEVAMIYQFGSNDTYFKMLMTYCTGLGICLINTSMAIYLLVASKKSRLNENRV